MGTRYQDIYPSSPILNSAAIVRPSAADLLTLEPDKLQRFAQSFDFTGWGESGGDICYLEDPDTKTADIMAAATFMAGLDQVDEKRICGVGYTDGPAPFQRVPSYHYLI
jgi:hypothetical protein